jgi:hypothetical protein
MKKIIRKILKEDRRQEYLNKIIKIMKNDYPLLYNLKLYGFYDQLLEEELYYVLSGVFGEPVRIGSNGYGIYDKNNNEIYWEEYDGAWEKFEHDENGNMIYSKTFDGEWGKHEYDEDNNEIYYENSEGYWWKREYDENGIQLYFEDSDGLIRNYR